MRARLENELGVQDLTSHMNEIKSVIYEIKSSPWMTAAELREKIEAILKDVDLKKTSAKKVCRGFSGFVRMNRFRKKIS